MAVIFALSFRPYPNNIRRQNSMLMTNIVVPTDLGGTGVRAIGLMLDRELLLVGKATSVGAFVVRRIDGRRACLSLVWLALLLVTGLALVVLLR
jgi:hypothetical protein